MLFLIKLSIVLQKLVLIKSGYQMSRFAVLCVEVLIDDFSWLVIMLE